MAGTNPKRSQPSSLRTGQAVLPAELDRGTRGSRVAARSLIALVVAFTFLRLVAGLILGEPMMRPWVGALMIVISGGLLCAVMPYRSAAARFWAPALGWSGLFIGLTFSGLNLAQSPPTWLDQLLGAYPSAFAPSVAPTRPVLLTSLLTIAMSTIVLLLDRARPMAVWASTALLTIAGSLGYLLLNQILRGDSQVAVIVFRSSPVAALTSLLSMLTLVLAACLARPRRLPLAPLISTGVWPLVLVGGLGLTLAAVVGQVVPVVAQGAITDRELSLTRAAAESIIVLSTAGLMLWLLSRMQYRRSAELQAQATKQAFADVMLDSAIGMAILDHSGVIRQVNPALCQLAGQQAEDLVGRPWQRLQSAADQSLTFAALHHQVEGSPTRTRISVTRPDGTVVWADVTITSARSGNSDSDDLLAQFVDVTDQLDARDQLQFAASHDPLTGLLTREETAAQLADHLDRERGSTVLVMAIDLDNFKLVNDAFGHSVGDRVLAEQADRIGELAGSDGWAGRVGGDEFVLTLPLAGAEHSGDASFAVEAVIANLERPVALGDQELRVGISVGAVVWGELQWDTEHSLEAGPEASDAPTALATADNDPLSNASAALRAAKAGGGGRWQMYDDSMRRAARAKVHLLTELNRDIEPDAPGRLMTWYQPIVELRSEEVCGYEALVRWERAGVVMPAGEWIETAEADTRLIHQIALLTCDDAARFAAQLPAGQHVSINVSGSHINSRYFSEFAEHLKEANASVPDRLAVEITETALARITSPVRRTLTDLAESGLPLWVDDFGTGYSSLTHLRDLPISGLKLDRSFVALLDSSSPRTAKRIASGVAGLAHGLRLDTIAEGVETPRQAAELLRLGWVRAQGWLYGRSGPASEFGVSQD